MPENKAVMRGIYDLSKTAETAGQVHGSHREADPSQQRARRIG